MNKRLKLAQTVAKDVVVDYIRRLPAKPEDRTEKMVTIRKGLRINFVYIGGMGWLFGIHRMLVDSWHIVEFTMLTMDDCADIAKKLERC